MTEEELKKAFASGKVVVAQESVNNEPVRNMLPATPPKSPPSKPEPKK
jgi:hypothetical protein